MQFRDTVFLFITDSSLLLQIRFGQIRFEQIWFERIRFDGYEPADGSIYYLKRKQRDEAARSQYRQLAMQMDLDGIFMRDILRDRLHPEDIVLRV